MLKTTFSRALSSQETKILSNFFECYLKSLETRDFENLKKFNLEKRFQNRLRNFFEDFPNLTFQKQKNELLQIKIENVGKFHIFGVDLEREKNDFIHEYEINRNEMKLFFRKKSKDDQIEFKSQEQVLVDKFQEFNKTWKVKVRENFYLSNLKAMNEDFIIEKIRKISKLYRIQGKKYEKN
jgi:hypothetical protein